MEIHLTETTVDLQLEWHERLWAFHIGRMISIPLDHMTQISEELPTLPWNTLRAPGTSIPGLFAAGTFYTPQGREFWYVTRQPPYLAISLEDEYYKRIVVSVDNSSSIANQLRTRMSQRGNSSSALK